MKSKASSWLSLLLRRRRWLVMLLMGVIIIVVEAWEHIGMGESLLTSHFIMEILFYGLMLPFLGAVLLSWIDRLEVSRHQAMLVLDQEYEFSRQLEQASNWENLVKLILKFFKTMLPVQAVHLYAREPEQNTVALIASNGNQGEAAARAAAALQPGNCVSCSYWWSPTASLQQCDFPASSASADQPISYCLTLAPQGDISAILRLFLPGNAQVAPEQLNRLVRFAPEMALAIKNVHLRHLVQSQSEAAEADRQRIARDLHDTLGQNLSYLRLKLDQISCQSSLQTISEIQNDIERMRDIANEAYAQMRGTLADLNLNSQIELETAIRAQANLVSERAKFRLELTSQGQTIALHSHTKRQLLYVCREALNNIEKHADARLVGICLDWGEQDLRITISDDGRGFDPEDTYRENHYGLAIMAERAAEINGRLSIHSKPGQGTQVVLYLPLPVAQSNLV